MGYAGAVAAIAFYLSLVSGLARTQEAWSAPIQSDRIGLSSGPAITGWPQASTYSIAARITIHGPAGGQTNRKVGLGECLPT